VIGAQRRIDELREPDVRTGLQLEPETAREARAEHDDAVEGSDLRRG
jgi:hypothetical protein